MPSQGTTVLQSLKSAPVRLCRSMHDCCICPNTIANGQYYADRGYGKRAHLECVRPLLPAQEMADLHFIEWDRFAESDDECVVYGWIPREDGSRDFVVLRSVPDGIGYITSSARFTDDIGAIIAGDAGQRRGHDRCIRVEVVLPGLPNAIRLP